MCVSLHARPKTDEKAVNDTPKKRKQKVKIQEPSEERLRRATHAVVTGHVTVTARRDGAPPAQRKPHLWCRVKRAHPLLVDKE